MNYFTSELTKTRPLLDYVNVHSITASFNPTQDGWEDKKGTLTSFSSVTCTYVRISPQNLLTFSFNPFPRLV